MTIDYSFINSFIDEQKSIFEREKTMMSETIFVMIKEMRSNVIQIGSGCAFLVAILFGMVTANWITDQLGQLLIIISILVAAFLIFSLEYFRKKIQLSILQVSASYSNTLWTMSELKRTITVRIVLEEKLDYKVLYFFIFCVVCSERVKMITDFEDLFKIPIFRMKAADFNQFYLEYEDIIMMGKTTLEDYSKIFKSTKYLEKLLPAIKSLEDYKIKSKK